MEKTTASVMMVPSTFRMVLGRRTRHGLALHSAEAAAGILVAEPVAAEAAA